MVFPMILVKIAAQYWPLISCYRAARKIRNYVFHHRRPTIASSWFTSTLAAGDEEASGRDDSSSIVVSADSLCGSLLRPASTPFPYFMLVAFEGGSLLRALLLLLSSPLLCAIGYHSQLSINIMLFITFCGLRVKDVDLVVRAVLPKFYLQNLNLNAYEALMQQQAAAAHKGSGSGRRPAVVVVFSTSLPRVMVAGFLKEYLGVDEVVGIELKVVKLGGCCYFSGLISGSTGLELKHKGLKERFGETILADVGLVGSYNKHDHLFVYLSHCKEVYKNIVSSKEEILTRDKYPKPLIFHDSRLAFLPTPVSTLALFLFLPLLIPLSVARIVLGILPPYKLIFPIAALTGTRFRAQTTSSSSSSSLRMSTSTNLKAAAGVLYVCNHRTLLDPVMLATALQRPIPAVTYSVSPLSEAIAPMRTVRLTRNRETDAKTMAQLLKEGNLTLCPEGTTCREPYLLRFSPLFAEVAQRIVPAAMDAQGSWFYGTTASGLKSLDPLFFFMNPTPTYRVRLLDELPEEFTCARGGWTGSEVANRIQKQLGDALGFECTSFTRKDKYMMLAGNEGRTVVRTQEYGSIEHKN